MPRGGARTRSGPAPDPSALRRVRDEGEWVTLPASGGLSRAPKWPLTGQSERESQLWCDLWKQRPQALMWSRLGLHYEVALYVRRLAEAEMPGSAVNLSTLVRQMADSLGLTTPGMRANRWRMASDELSQRSAAPRAQASAVSARDRMRVIPHASGE